MGVTVAERCIYTAGAAAADYVMDHFGQRPRVYNLATDGAQEMLDGKVQWVSAAAEPCDVVLVGTPGSVWATEDRQRVALDILRGQRSCALLGMCADRVFPSPRGIEFGCGAMTAMLSYAADVKPVFTGKPEPVFFHDLCRRIGVEPGRCVLVGDNLESDIYGGNRVGMTTVLALSGVARREDLASLSAERQPRHVIQDLRELLPPAS
jgi:4-nitrophenyl phosphatase